MAEYKSVVVWNRDGAVFTDIGGERRPAADDVIAMHREPHEQCYIANSVKTDVHCTPISSAAP